MSQTKGEHIMTIRGDHTRQEILTKAYQLFAEKGFKDVTMKDICEQTGLSRGGLYRHYESTEQIFLEIVNHFSDRQREKISAQTARQTPASVILDNLLSVYEREMADSENSLSLAICEFFSDPTVSKTDNSVRRQYALSRAAWTDLIRYGISTNEFVPVDPESVFHMILFAYQGVRMYSRLTELPSDVPHQIIHEIKRLLYSGNPAAENSSLTPASRINTEISLVRPSPDMKEKALAYRQEHFAHGEAVIYGSELFDQTENYEEWLSAVTLNTDPETVNKNWVVTDTYFAVRNSDSRIVGIIDLRHTLNEFLKDLGNCGYSVRPSERKKGYASQMLHLLLPAARDAGLTQLHISVERENTASVKVIQKNGGVYERSFSFEGKPADIYKIIL